jgi:hypothetical protein
MRRSAVAQAVWVAAFTLEAACTPATPVNQPVVPESRTGASSAFDPAGGAIVMFGGANRSGVLGDTWTWAGNGWQQKRPSTSPQPRESAYMAFDPSMGRVVLFGGTTCAPPRRTDPIGCDYQQERTNLSDTWTWDGTNWSQLQTQHAPRIGAFQGDFGSMAADGDRGHLILATWASPQTQSSIETWTLRDGDWMQLHPKDSPGPYEFSGPAFDPVSGHLIVQQQGARLDVTWMWDGSDWEDLGLSTNTPHTYGQLLSAGRHGLILIAPDGTYPWNGRSWGGYQLLPASMQPLGGRYGWTAAYYEPTRQLVLFGGRAGPGSNHLFADTQTWDGSSWKTAVPAPASPSIALPPCSATEAVSGIGSGALQDQSGASFDLEFFEPLSGPCHLHVDVVATLFTGNYPITISGNPSTQPLDADLTWAAGGKVVTFNAIGICSVPGASAQIQAGDFVSPYLPLLNNSPCPVAPQAVPRLTSSVRSTPGRP